MKSFLKFIIVIIVVCVMAATLYFFLNAGKRYNELYPNESGDVQENTNSGEQNGENTNNGEQNQGNLGSGEDVQNGNDEQNENQENSGDVNNSGDVESKIEYINLIENQNHLAKLTNTFEESVGIEIIGKDAEDYFESFEVDNVGVNVQVAGTMIYIIPAPDFLNNAQYHYDENGNLLLYVCELTGVGGEVRYYFDNGNLISQTNTVEEDIEINYEDTTEILNRAKAVYDKYMKN